jgi:hypothetical protein
MVVRRGRDRGRRLPRQYTVALYLASLALGLALSPQRKLLARSEPWAAAALAAALAAPNLVWQAQNGWPFVAHTAALSGEIIPYSPASFFLQEIQILNPATAPVWIAGLAAFAFWPQFAPHRWVAISWAILFAACVVGRGRPFYIAPAYPLLMAGGAVALEAWLPRLAKPVLAGAALALGALSAPMSLPILPVDAFIAYEHALGSHPDSTGRNFVLHDLPQYYADQFGWPEIVTALGEAYQALPPEERARAAVFAWNWGDAAAADMFGGPWSLPPATRHQRRRELLALGPARRGRQRRFGLRGTAREARSKVRLGRGCRPRRQSLRHAGGVEPDRPSSSAAAGSSRSRKPGRSCLPSADPRRLLHVKTRSSRLDS